MKWIIALTMVSFGSLASAESVVHLTCFTAGNSPQRVFDGTLVASDIVDHSEGSFTVKGRKIQQRKIMDSSMNESCRDWYIRSQSWVDSDNRFTYTYSNRDRNWNTVEVSKQAATVRMSCAIGSIITEYDSIPAYLAELRLKWVESQPPRNGTRDSLLNHISGKSTVTNDACVINQL